MEKNGWGNESKGATATVDDLIALSKSSKETDQTKKTIETPGKYIKIYELHGTLPDWWLDKNEPDEEENK